MVIIEFNKSSCMDFNINDLERLKDFKIEYELNDNNSKIAFYSRGLEPLSSLKFSFSLEKIFAFVECSERTHSSYLYYGKEESVVFQRV